MGYAFLTEYWSSQLWHLGDAQMRRPFREGYRLTPPAPPASPPLLTKVNRLASLVPVFRTTGSIRVLTQVNREWLTDVVNAHPLAVRLWLMFLPAASSQSQ